MEQMTLEQFDEIGRAIDDAQADITPFPIMTEDELVIAGDANKTEIQLSDFEITFRVPTKSDDGKLGFRSVKKEYKDVFIQPRQDGAIVQAIVALLPFYKKIQEDGGVDNMSREEKLQVFNSLTNEMFDAMYNLVGLVLGLDNELKEYMLPGDVLVATTKILTQYRATVNEADGFFG